MYPSSGHIEIAVNKYVTLGAYIPPLGLLYLGKMLESNGHKVDIIDCNAEEINEEKIKSKTSSYDAIGMTVYSKPEELTFSKKLASIIKENVPDIPLIIGGPHCTVFPEGAMKEHNADICLCGEGEFRINPLIDSIEGKRKIDTINGVYYKQGNRIKNTKSAEITKDINKIPFPARHLVEKYDYGHIIKSKLIRGKVTSIITSRGCPHRCRYCQIQTYVPKFRTRTIENITQEIEEISNQGYTSVVFSDDNFLAQKKKVEKIMDFIIKKELGLKFWIINARVDSADKNLYEKLRDAGVEAINFGIESGNQDVLDYYKKTITTDQARYAVDLSHEMGFFVSANFIIGASIETRKHIENTIKFAKSLPLDHAFFYTLGYLYGSPLWFEAVKEEKINKNEFWVNAGKERGLSSFTEEELQQFSQKASNSFYLNPSYLIRVLSKAFRSGDFRYIFASLRSYF
jgi:radical SAM superfamily enzyme YgiQ (UPF0313 family)